MDPDRLLLMGRVGRPHGVRGELKAVPETDTPERFADLERLFVGPVERAREMALDGVRFQYPKGRTVPLLAFADVDSIEAAEELRGAMLWADIDDLPALEEGEAYLHDLVGLAVFLVDEAGAEADEPFGTVADVYEGAQLLFAIDRPGAAQVLLPDVPEFVLRLDLAARRLFVRPPEGLIEE
ncbi:ribosome maturation factor RimM [Rubrivirga sp. IMCC45206]|uniref:ribosome maturation factor RimM n=1 Tax=Rubrivirga sp. IMCC45206 TaxID=3391614 RepID=UPI00398FF5B3